MELHEYAFEKLKVWEDIRELNSKIYLLTNNFPDNEKYGLVSQMRRSSISVGSNIAEGSSRTSAKDQSHFYQIAYSSLMELLSQLIVSYDLSFIEQEKYSNTRELIQKISFKINALRNPSLKRT